jgi:hypothetical protein
MPMTRLNARIIKQLSHIYAQNEFCGYRENVLKYVGNIPNTNAPPITNTTSPEYTAAMHIISTQAPIHRRNANDKRKVRIQGRNGNLQRNTPIQGRCRYNGGGDYNGGGAAITTVDGNDKRKALIHRRNANDKANLPDYQAIVAHIRAE